MGEDLRGGVALRAAAATSVREEGGEEAEEGCVSVNVVEGRAVVDLRVVIQNVGVQAGVHPFPRST